MLLTAEQIQQLFQRYETRSRVVGDTEKMDSVCKAIASGAAEVRAAPETKE